tara:strand:+ start:453 stop:752 length:300 start_codon:yes stop_codon:yes gene_type:complete
MSDEELTKMLRSSANRVVNYAGDRIDALTAERDHAWEMVAKADTQVGQALADRLQDKAQIDCLMEALWEILACETPNANATVTRMATIARAVLKGASHD